MNPHLKRKLVHACNRQARWLDTPPFGKRFRRWSKWRTAGRNACRRLGFPVIP